MKLRLRRTSSRRPVAQRSAFAVVTLAATMGVAGCAVFSPATVLKPYEPSDGTGTTVGAVTVRNALVVSSGVDEPGVLSVVLVNPGPDPATVSVSVDVDAGAPAAQSFFLAAGSSLHLGDPSAVADDAAATDDDSGTQSQVGWVQVPQVPVTPGETVPVTFRVDGQAQAVQAPVVLPCFEYAAITPTAPSDTASASATPSPSVTCGPAVGEEPSAAEG
ncbi:hypothetical protein ACFQ46_18760 [Kineococcus sp. GCM10028916]|uniref:hypothetical protein n=1 Tax=Kineococcus sp. GCM10028916 TaxID=3273394 RepID=UPI00362B6584